jgi:predicted DNA-binding transcriptional regulator YafY
MRNRQLVRQLGILRRLVSTRAAVPRGELAEAFHVSTRTIRRDIAAIEEAGFPLLDVIIEDETGRVGWQLMESRDVSRLLSVQREAGC